MKYISLLILLILMAWTWSMAKSNRDYGVQESRELENQIEAIITEYVRNQRPTLKDIRFQQLYTEVVRPNEEIRVHLRYTVTDSTKGGDIAEQGFQGIVLLKSTDGKTWAMAGQDVRSPIVEFKNGAKVSTRETPSTEASDTSEDSAPETPEPPVDQDGHSHH